MQGAHTTTRSVLPWQGHLVQAAMQQCRQSWSHHHQLHPKNTQIKWIKHSLWVTVNLITLIPSFHCGTECPVA